MALNTHLTTNSADFGLSQSQPRGDAGLQTRAAPSRPAMLLSWSCSCRECEEPTPREELSDDDLCISCAEDQQAHGLTVRERFGYGR